MSLEKKLSEISNQIKEKEAKENKKLQEEKLAPIRLKIKELEEIKFQLELVLGSLNLNSKEKNGQGMKEYSIETERKFENEDNQIDNLINKNQEALESIGIKSKDQLLENEDFSEDEEIIDYKKAKENKEGLELSDLALKDKLLALGINIGEDLSYELAEKLLQEKIEQVDKELALEKGKTPEGQEELKEELIQYFDKKIPNSSFSKDKDYSFYNKKYVLDLGRDYSNIVFNENEIERFYIMNDSTERQKIEERYPYNIIREAMTKVLRNKINNASYSYGLSGSYDRETPELEEFKNMVKSKFLPMFEKKLNRQLRENELRYEAKIQGFYFDNIEDVKRRIELIESNKKEAEILLNEISKIEAKLPNEKVIFNGAYVKVPSAIEKQSEFQKETNEKEKRLEEVKFEIENLERNKPKIFGKEKWNSNLNTLKQERGKLIKRTDREWYNEENNKLYEKAYFYIPVKEYSIFEKILREQPGIQCNSKEVFKELKTKIEEIKNEEVPEALLKLYKEFSDLIEK